MEKFSASVEWKKSFVSRGKSETLDVERMGYSFSIAVHDENQTRIGTVFLDHIKDTNLSERIGEVFYIEKIDVVQSQRGRGNGSEIVESINRFLISRGNALGVLSDGIMKLNAESALRGLYERHGWKDISRDKRYLKLDKLDKNSSSLDWRSKVGRLSAGKWKYFYQGADIDDTEYERLCHDVIMGSNFFFKKKG